VLNLHPYLFIISIVEFKGTNIKFIGKFLEKSLSINFNIKNQFTPLGFCWKAKHSAAWYQQLVLELALIVFQIFRQWFGKTKLSLSVRLSTNLLFLLEKIIPF